MAAFLHPGIYVLDTTNQPSITAAPSSTAIFVGEAERGPLLPTKLSTRSDYTRQYGGYLRKNSITAGTSPTLAYAMDAFFNNGGTDCYVLRVMNNFGNAAPATRAVFGAGWTVKLNASSPGTWANGTKNNGLYAIILPPSDGSPSRFRIVVVYTPLDTELQSIVEDWDRLSSNPNSDNYVVDVLNRSLYIRWDPNTTPAVPTTFDGPPALPPSQILALAIPPPNSLSTALVGGVGGDTDARVSTDFQFALLDDVSDAALLVVPRTSDDSSVPAINSAAIAYAVRRPRQDLFYIGSLSRHRNQVLVTNAVQDAVKEYQDAGLPKTDLAAMYFPWVFVHDPVGSGKNPKIATSPSALMAGVYARTDHQRGVWKAPAGLDAILTGVLRPEFDIQDIQQDIMNPLGINALRVQPDVGLVSWGTRTMVPDSQWRYIPVRRMAIFLRKSIYDGIQFAVFEPNNDVLWTVLRNLISEFMRDLFRQGAFAGESPGDAYFVRCDADTTPATDQTAGIVNIVIGFSPVRPAEFVVIRLSQIVSQKA